MRNMVFIEPEPDAGGTEEVFAACARQLPRFQFGVWAFRHPFDRLFRLSPRYPTGQAIYTYTRDRGLLDMLAPYARPL